MCVGMYPQSCDPAEDMQMWVMDGWNLSHSVNSSKRYTGAQNKTSLQTGRTTYCSVIDAINKDLMIGRCLHCSTIKHSKTNTCWNSSHCSNVVYSPPDSFFSLLLHNIPRSVLTQETCLAAPRGRLSIWCITTNLMLSLWGRWINSAV